MKEAGREATKVIRNGTPKRWRRLVKFKVVTTRDRQLNTGMGLFNNHQHQGHQSRKGAPMDDWFKAYWANYGTLKHRDPNHVFTKPIKNNKKRRNEEGQRAENFFEAAIRGIDDVYYKKFEEAFFKRADQL